MTPLKMQLNQNNLQEKKSSLAVDIAGKKSVAITIENALISHGIPQVYGTGGITDGKK